MANVNPRGERATHKGYDCVADQYTVPPALTLVRERRAAVHRWTEFVVNHPLRTVDDLAEYRARLLPVMLSFLRHDFAYGVGGVVYARENDFRESLSDDYSDLETLITLIRLEEATEAWTSSREASTEFQNPFLYDYERRLLGAIQFSLNRRDFPTLLDPQDLQLAVDTVGNHTVHDPGAVELAAQFRRGEFAGRFDIGAILMIQMFSDDQ